MSKPVIQIENLNVGFNVRQGMLDVLHGISFDLHRGKTTCVVGESGSGKSVTARTILNMVPRPGVINGGRILFNPVGGDTIELTALDPRGREIRSIRGGRVGMIFQEPMSSLSPVHTIGSQIVEAIRLHRDVSKKEAKQMAVDSLRQVEIPNPEKAVDRYAFEFSGGMRQRAMIAMALACRPEVLIADEPTTALDVTTQAEILDLMKKLQEELGMAIMFITHDMGVVAEIADEVVVMERGHVVEVGDCDRIFNAPEHPYTQKLLGAVKRLEEPAAAKVRPAGDAPEILKVRDLQLHFEKREGFMQRVTDVTRAVDGISFDLKKGEALGIVGESGSGKTTVGRCIARVYDPQGGSVDYEGRDLVHAGKEELRQSRQQIRMIFQDPFASLNPRMTVKQLIAEPLIVNGVAQGAELDARVAKLLTEVGLDPGMMERYPHAFSGGQRQRIVVARAIALEPRLVIADEPTSALDVSIRTQVLDLLLKLQAEMGLSFIFISHDMAVIRYFCDRVAVMYRGKIVEIGETEQIITDPQHPYTKALLSSVPISDPALRGTRQRHRYVESA
ncbi:ABC transporter ATP-binding protein [Psychromarinibacter halotolerans]|uniref:ABC transporter ATP-binding protein n=1 Tax=Psychromarinibacter halotolerans TaxID=1775175 RepID=A0ABV7GT83_9RHOB|nr:ABC transporter ATP-binding protein [Psychromarinibacter halotolerans]MDF0597281.1 ABC transporter ATP-binding protein [Psychromarinibacter halotolerans]